MKPSTGADLLKAMNATPEPVAVESSTAIHIERDSMFGYSYAFTLTLENGVRVTVTGTTEGAGNAASEAVRRRERIIERGYTEGM